MTLPALFSIIINNHLLHARLSSSFSHDPDIRARSSLCPYLHSSTLSEGCSPSLSEQDAGTQTSLSFETSSSIREEFLALFLEEQEEEERLRLEEEKDSGSIQNEGNPQADRERKFVGDMSLEELQRVSGCSSVVGQRKRFAADTISCTMIRYTSHTSSIQITTQSYSETNVKRYQDSQTYPISRSTATLPLVLPLMLGLLPPLDPDPLLSLCHSSLISPRVEESGVEVEEMPLPLKKKRIKSRERNQFKIEKKMREARRERTSTRNGASTKEKKTAYTQRFVLMLLKFITSAFSYRLLVFARHPTWF